MNSDQIIEFAVSAIWLVVVVSLPVLVGGLVTGVVVGALQSLTQVQDQSITLITRLIVMLVILAVMSPWMIAKIVEFSKLMFNLGS